METMYKAMGRIEPQPIRIGITMGIENNRK
jgi:hypothetical protein